MATFHVRPQNPLKAGVMIEAFQGSDQGLENVQAFLVSRCDDGFPIDQVHKLAEAFVRTLNTGVVPHTGLSANDAQLYFSPEFDNDKGKNAFYLTYRNPADSQTAEGGNSVAGLEFRILESVSAETRAFILRRLSTPGVMQAFLGSISMAGDVERAPGQKPTPQPTSPGFR